MSRGNGWKGEVDISRGGFFRNIGEKYILNVVVCVIDDFLPGELVAPDFDDRRGSLPPSPLSKNQDCGERY